MIFKQTLFLSSKSTEFFTVTVYLALKSEALWFSEKNFVDDNKNKTFEGYNIRVPIRKWTNPSFPLSFFIYNMVYTVDAFIVGKNLLIHGPTHFPKVKRILKNFYLRADPYKI